MAVVFTEGWGGNRVYKGSAWMELYYAVRGELNGDPAWSLTGNGKFPNWMTSVFLVLHVTAVFDSNTQDNNNTFIQNGAHWPGYSGSVNIPAVREKNVYNQKFLHWPGFSPGSVQARASLYGIDRVSGTTSFDRWITIPARAWATPDQPSGLVGSYNVATNKVKLTWGGNQLNSGQDKFWQSTRVTIYRVGETWIETGGLSSELTSYEWDANLNWRHLLGVRSWNEDGGFSAWSGWAEVYTKPSAPTLNSVTRQAGDSTKVDVSFTNTAAFPGRHRIYRRYSTGDAYVEVGSVAAGASVYTDTVPRNQQAHYVVCTETPPNVVQSDNSNSMSVGYGWATPDAPATVTLKTDSSNFFTVSVTGNQSNPAVDKYWESWSVELQTDSAAFEVKGTAAGDAPSFEIPSSTVALPNKRYRAQVRATNVNGSSGYTQSGFIYTKPLAASNVVAARVDVTTAVNISWTQNAAHPGSTRVQRSLSGGAWLDVATVGAGVTSYTDTLDTAAYARYRVVTLNPTGTPADPSEPSATVSTAATDKDRLPGIDKIFAGDIKVFRVLSGTEQIWLG